MLFIKYILITAATGLLGAAAAVVIADIYNSVRGIQPMDVRWRAATRLALLAWIPLLPALSVVVVPSGMAGVRVSQLSGTLAGTLYPGTHLVMPLVHRVELFNIRDQVFSTNPTEAAKDRCARRRADSGARVAVPPRVRERGGADRAARRTDCRD
jgi:hypothetical protein